MISRVHDNPAYSLFAIMTELPLFLNKSHNSIFISLKFTGIVENNAEVKNDWSYTSTPPIRIHAEGRDNFITEM